MSRPKYLSKSLFKNALDCRTKLYYAANNDMYNNNNVDDPFLTAIAEGGFQVGELAKCYYPGGIEIDPTLSAEDNFEETKKLLTKKNVVIFEGVIIFENFMMRFDIIEKKDNTLRLIEVKSKSYAGGDCSEFLNKNRTIKAAWVDNMYDASYQKWVLSKMYPTLKIETFLMLADKTKTTTVDNLNQKFLLTKTNKGKTKVVINGDVSLSALGDRILTEINIDDIVSIIESYDYTEGKSFEEWLYFLMNSFENNIKLPTKLGKKCDECQFVCGKAEFDKGLKSGKNECWASSPLIGETNIGKPTVLDLWNYRSKDKKISEGVMLMKDINPTEFMPKFESYEQVSAFFSLIDREMSDKERQALQLWKTNTGDDTLFVNTHKLKEEMSNWVFPLHMIDFETTAVAIPLHKGMRPYEGIAFQFSHHTIFKDGRVEHTGQYINTTVGHFPNFDFVRALKSQLSNDKGSIFKYSPHENSYLNMILIQMLKTSDAELPDKEELISFIKSITHKSSSDGFSEFDIADWVGDRDMIDLLDIIKKYYYNPYANGSNSIKHILPAILKSSKFLKDKYSQPIYGTSEVKSTNFNNHTWVNFDDNGDVIDPYKQLPKVFDGIDASVVDTFITADKIADGGAAMTAYAKIQFSEMSNLERSSVANALLKYCELDTFAMVMLYEHFAELVYGNTYVKTTKPVKPPRKNLPTDGTLPADNNAINVTEPIIEDNPIKLEMSSLYGEFNQTTPLNTYDMEKSPVKKRKTNSPNSSTKNTWTQGSFQFDSIVQLTAEKSRSKKIKRSTRKIETEKWITRFKKDSTEQLILKMNSSHYNRFQKMIIGEIINKREQIESEVIVSKLKKESTKKITRLLNSQNTNDFKKNVIQEILLVRKTKV